MSVMLYDRVDLEPGVSKLWPMKSLFEKLGAPAGFLMCVRRKKLLVLRLAVFYAQHRRSALLLNIPLRNEASGMHLCAAHHQRHIAPCISASQHYVV